MNCYELLKSLSSACKLMQENGIDVRDAKYLTMYEEYMAMKAGGDKYSYIMAVLCGKYGISECSVWRVIRRMRKDVEM